MGLSGRLRSLRPLSGERPIGQVRPRLRAYRPEGAFAGQFGRTPPDPVLLRGDKGVRLFLRERNLQGVDIALRQYWSMKFPDDPMERTYVRCFSKSKALHLHFHLIPRTRKLGQGNPTEFAAWRIFELKETWADFPESYRVRDKEKNWAHFSSAKVTALMMHLREFF